MIKRLVITVAGMALMLAYWSFKGSSGSSRLSSTNGIPSKVWEGGGTTVTVEVTTDTPARFSIWFSDHPEGQMEKRSLETSETIPVGTKEYVIDVPRGVGGTVEASAIDPKPGATMSFKVRNVEKLFLEHGERLDGPLRAGEAFAIQDYVTDFASGTVEGR
jgi:hypothetical protein